MNKITTLLEAQQLIADVRKEAISETTDYHLHIAELHIAHGIMMIEGVGVRHGSVVAQVSEVSK